MIYMFIVLIAIGTVLLDQISKILVRTLMFEGQTIPLIPGFLSLAYYNNSGIAFSFLSGHRIIVTALQIVALLAVAVFLFKTKGKRRLYDFSLAIILGGGIGNVIDRVIFGKVTDMISFSIFPPVFNVADIGVTVGCALLILDIILEYRESKFE